MNKHARTVCAVRHFLCSLTIVAIALTTANGQQKPKATWADVDLDSKVEAAKVASTAKPSTLDPEKRKSIWREPAWYVSIAGSALDIAGSIATIDGKRVYESNALFKRADGKLSLARALPVTAIGLYLQYRYYKNPKHRKFAIASMIATGIIRGALGGARGFMMR